MHYSQSCLIQSEVGEADGSEKVPVGRDEGKQTKGELSWYVIQRAHDQRNYKENQL